MTSKVATALAAGSLAWIFPATYVVHACEEYFGGFPTWFSRTFDASLTNPGFLAINAIGFTLFFVAALGALTLHACWSALPRPSFWTGVLAGLALQAAAFLAASRGGLQ